MAAALTASRVAAPIRGSSASARDAVEPETFTRCATSLSRTRRRGPSDLFGPAPPLGTSSGPPRPRRASRREAIEPAWLQHGGVETLAPGPHLPWQPIAQTLASTARRRQQIVARSGLEQPAQHLPQPAADRKRIGRLPVRRAVELVVPPAVEAGRPDRVDPLPERDQPFPRPDPTRTLVRVRNTRRSERVSEVDAMDDPCVEPGDLVRRRAPLPEMPEVQDEPDVVAFRRVDHGDRLPQR